MKTGDKEVIAFKSIPALEILLDRADSQPDTDTAHPQNDVTIILRETDKSLSVQRRYRYTCSFYTDLQIKQEAN